MGRALPQEHYEMVADVYNEAIEGGRAATTNMDIAETWGVPKTTADRWVKRCRQLGLLGPRQVGVCRGRCPVCCSHAHVEVTS